MLLILLEVRAGVADSCADIHCLYKREPQWARNWHWLGGEGYKLSLVCFTKKRGAWNPRRSCLQHGWSPNVIWYSFSQNCRCNRSWNQSVSATGQEKTGVTVVLACSESGKKLKPIVIFKHKTMLKEILPDGAVVHCHKKTWMDRDGMAVWGEKVWRARPVSFFNRTLLLIFHGLSAHINEGIWNTYKTTTAVIPGGLTKKLQLLDISVDCFFKNYVREEWEKWMSEEIHTFTETGKMKRATHAEVCDLVVWAWKAINVFVHQKWF